MSVVSRKAAKRSELTALSQDSTNRTIALGQYRHEVEPDLIESLYRRAQELKADGDYPAALSLLQGLPPATDSPLMLQGMMLRAELLCLKGDYTQACLAYERLQAHAEQDASLSTWERQRLQGLVQLNLAWIQEQHGKSDAALLAYDLAIVRFEPLRSEQEADILPALMMAYRQRARVLRRLGRIDAALQDLQESAHCQERLLTPQADSTLEDVSSWFALGQMQQELEHWQQALESFDFALRLSARIGDPATHALWGGMIRTQQARSLEQLGLLEAAAERYAEVLQDFSLTLSPLQRVLLQVLKASALMRLKRPIPIEDFTAIRAELQVLELAGSDRFELAIPLLALADLSHDQDPDWALDFYGAAIRCLEQSDRLPEDESQRLLVDAYRGRGILLERKGQLPKSLASFKQAQRHAEQVLEPLMRSELELQLGLVLQSAGKSDQALTAFTKARELAPQDPDPDSVWFRAAYFHAFILAGMPDQASAALQALLALDTVSPRQVDYDLACLHARLQQPEQALDRLLLHLQSSAPLSREDILADPDLAALEAESRWQELWEGARGEGREKNRD
ncbi:MAG: tetratricopeptide repeat protein [Candidatus Sericytochromatia bacterium]